ncbi:uncharacterized protein LOC100124033 [Nasonia vitripennis]|uniref:Superoxide dismutase copper/zinc binding domain-containing protein n=1 Tax=Nasonia vitripennis TaxID=7425 RepID=A0A7M7H728_NASVI|nr:uncharacterized protein LOC100124033 [Nasonia vitripennis]
MANNRLWFLQLLLLVTCVATGNAVRLAAYISSGGLHGEIRFEPANNNNVRIRLALKTTLQYPDQQWHWHLTEFPVDYTLIENRCDSRNLGKSVVDLTELVGPLDFPGNETGSIEVSGLSLSGEKGLWGKGILMRDTYSNRVICASVTVLDRNTEKLAEARFNGDIAGSVWMRWLGGSASEDSTDTIIHTNLQHTSNRNFLNESFSEHHWKIYVTDIFDTGKERTSCSILQTVFDPDNSGSGKSIGDIDARLGKIRVASRVNSNFRQAYRDPGLAILPADLIGPHHVLYLVIFHPTHNDIILGCAKIKPRKAITAKAIVNSRGIKGEVTLIQETPFDPTWVNVSLSPINDLETRIRYETKVVSYSIHELPKEPEKLLQDTIEPCLTTKNLYDPLKINENTVPPAGLGTQDQYAVGDLTGKLQGRKEGSHHLDILPGSAKLSGLYWDAYLPLSGINSVVHRSLVIHKYNESDNDATSVIPWVCSTFSLQLPNNAGQMPMITAEVTFRYPIVGKVIFRQPRNEPEMDTTIIIEHLIHADGSSLNDSVDHRWMIHDEPPGQDYYNWTSRCLSAGAPYNPYEIEWDDKQPQFCSEHTVPFCRMGDFTRHGNLNIAGRKKDGLRLTRKLFTDTLLTLSGPTAIFGKSLVIYDDHGPKARGERLACSIITGLYRRKAVAKDWFGNGEEISLGGKLEFIQESAYDVTDVEVNLEGLNGKMSGYHVHMTPVEIDLTFPCEGTSLYGHWNPLNVDPSTSPPSTSGTSDQYEMGDLSGKFGTLDGRRRYMSVYNDTQLPLFGPRSILGRSIIVHKKEKNARWACTTIERGYAPSEARELRAIASFHHPQGYAYGYIRMTQLIYKDGSQSDTVMEVKLRHPGRQDRNVTRNHNWAIYVNPVGVDATVQIKDTRCVAGGYRWNPYFTQLADPLNEDLYRQECGPDLPLRCDVGDVSARVGPIDIGVERRVFSDPNFPLEGKVTALGKSIVILDKDFGSSRFACANIEPDNDIVKYANIRKPPRFVAAQFLEDVRQVMGIPEWMLSIDNRKTKILHDGACIQFLLHFKGPIANKLEQDFSKLMTTGRLDAPSLPIPGYVPTKRKNTLGHRQCGTRDYSDKKSGKNSRFYYVSSAKRSVSAFLSLWSFLVVFVVS